MDVLEFFTNAKGILMKTSKSEIVYLILSILMVALAGSVYFLFGNRNNATNSSVVTKQVSTEQSTHSESKELSAAKAAVEALESNPSQENLTAAQEAIKSVKDDVKKTELQIRIDTVSAELTNETAAEEAVKAAENSQTTVNVTAAQETVDALTNNSKKAEHQARLDAVSKAIPTQASAVTNYDTTNTYSYSNTNSSTYSNQAPSTYTSETIQQEQ